MSLADNRRLRLATLCLMYVAQGIPWGFMATTLPAYLTQRGLDFAFVSATLSFTTLPYTFKWIWGPIIDAFTIPRFGRRRPWIIFAQAMMAITVIAIVAIPDLTAQIKLLAWMILIHTVFNSLQDVAVDALATDLLGDDERGVANGLMYGSKYAGGFIGGVVIAHLIARTNLQTALVVQTSILVAIMLLPIFLRERDGATPERPSVQVIVQSLGQAFSLRSTLVAAVLLLVANFGIGVITATAFKLFIGELGWSYERYTNISGGLGLAIGCGMAFLTGYLADKFGRRRVAAIATIALGAGWIGFALAESHWRDDTLIYVLGFYEGACSSALSVALIALAMDLSWPRIAGTQFAAYMALMNFGTTLGYQFAARANELWSFQGIYLLVGIVQVAVVFLLWPIDPKQARTSLPLPDGKRLNAFGLTALLALLAFLVAMTLYVTAQRLG